MHEDLSKIKDGLRVDQKAWKDEFLEALGASENRSQAAQLALENRLLEALRASENRSQAAQLALKEDLRADQLALKGDLHAAQIKSEERMHSHNQALASALTYKVLFLGCGVALGGFALIEGIVKEEKID